MTSSCTGRTSPPKIFEAGDIPSWVVIALIWAPMLPTVPSYDFCVMCFLCADWRFCPITTIIICMENALQAQMKEVLRDRRVQITRSKCHMNFGCLSSQCWCLSIPGSKLRGQNQHTTLSRKQCLNERLSVYVSSSLIAFLLECFFCDNRYRGWRVVWSPWGPAGSVGLSGDGEHTARNSHKTFPQSLTH